MTIQQFIAHATKQLAAAGIETARLDILLLLEDALNQDRAYLLAHPELPVPTKKQASLNKKVIRRARHEPIAYIRGHAPFYGRDFYVNSHVLVPRPETESLIELLLSLPKSDRPWHIADIGAGSGALGVTAALEIPASTIAFYDVSSSALQVTERNVHSHGIAVVAQFYRQDLLNPLHDSYTILLVNLPYVPERSPINKAAHFEPQIALFAGPDGLSLYQLFWRQITGLATAQKPHYIITESFPAQHHAMAVMARHAGYYLDNSLGFGQLFAKA